jgi:3-(3-hydroxy-phenyl)propionate hydroxylase
MRPGAPASDAPLVIDGRRTWLLRELGPDFTLLVWGLAPRLCAGLGCKVLALGPEHDADGWLAKRYDLRPGSAYLLRPDQHVAARWRQPTPAAVEDAVARATATL